MRNAAAMEVRTYRATTMHEALMLVRRDLGPDAAVLHTREVQTAAAVRLPSRPVPDRGHRLGGGERSQPAAAAEPCRAGARPLPSRLRRRLRPKPRPQPPRRPRRSLSKEVQGQLSHLHAMLEDLCRRSHAAGHARSARLAVSPLRRPDRRRPERGSRPRTGRAGPGGSPDGELNDPLLAQGPRRPHDRGRVPVTGPIRVTPGRRRLVALVGPTGVGKTTTIAKLAANYPAQGKAPRRADHGRHLPHRRGRAIADLRRHHRPADAGRLHAPRDARGRAAGWTGLDLVLMDTAGRSPRDEIKIQELKAFLTEAAADEVHLVLSSVAGAASPRADRRALRRRGHHGPDLSPSSTKPPGWATCCR